MSKSLTFAEWKKCAVHVSDARPFSHMIPDEFDAPDSFWTPRPMVLYLIPKHDDQNTYELCGHMTRSAVRMQWWVIIGNIENHISLPVK